MKYNKIIVLLILVLSLFFVASCNNTPSEDNQQNNDTNETDNGNANNTNYVIRVVEADHGKVTASSSKAKAGETVTLTVEPDFGYKLKENTLKVNDTEVSGNSFTMPASNVEVTAEFVADAQPLTVENTNLEFTVKNNNKTAKAHVSTKYVESGLQVKFVVEDTTLIVREDGKNDGVVLYTSLNQYSVNYLTNFTYLIDVRVDGTKTVSVYDGTNFVASTKEVEANVTLFGNETIEGYVVDITLPYALWDLSKQELDGNITICPGLHNNNSNSSVFSDTLGFATSYKLDYEQHNSFVVVSGDDTYRENENIYPGYYFKNIDKVVKNGSKWDLSADTINESGAVLLKGHDQIDNNLIFNIESSDFMYARATMKLGQNYNTKDLYKKIGLALLDGSDKDGVFYFADLSDDNISNKTAVFGTALIGSATGNDKYAKWTNFENDILFNVTSKTATLELVYTSGRLYFFVDGQLANSSYYQAKTDNLMMAVKSFGFGLELTNYYCTTNENDTLISTTMSKIADSVSVDNYGLEVEAKAVEHADVSFKYSAITRTEGTYIKALVTTPTLPKQQGTDNAWYKWTNFEFRVNDQLLYVTIAGNMETLTSNYHAFSNIAKDMELTLSQTTDDKYLITVNIFLGQLPAESKIKLNYCVIDSKACGVTNADEYFITNDGLEEISKYNIKLDGKTEDALWTNDVLTNYFTLKNNDETVKLVVNATRDNAGLYFYVTYYTNELHPGENWWQNDNIELRLVGPNGLLSNGQHENPFQWYVSNNKSFNVDGAYISDAVKNDELNCYVIVMEFVILNERLGIEMNTPVGLAVGSNPGGAGFFCEEGFDNGNILNRNKITSQGILENCLENECEHKYGQLHVEVEADCYTNGLGYKYCLYCNHELEVVAETGGKHVINYEKVTVVTPSTCTIEGVGTVSCICGQNTEEVELPLNLINHSAWDEVSGRCSSCNSTNGQVYDLDHYNYHAINYKVDGSKSFEFEVSLTAERTAASTAWGHNFVGEVYTDNWANGGWSYRSDWYGSDGHWAGANRENTSYTDINNGSWMHQYDKASANMDIYLRLKFDAETGTITITMTYTSNVDPYSEEVKYLTYTCKNISYRGEMNVGFGCDCSKVTFHSVTLLEGQLV